MQRQWGKTFLPSVSAGSGKGADVAKGVSREKGKGGQRGRKTRKRKEGEKGSGED